VKRLLTALALLGFCAIAAPARAAPYAPPTSKQTARSMPEQPLAPTRHVEKEWYGHYTLLTDTVSVLVLFGTSGNDSMVAGVGFVGYGFGAPLVHVFQGQPLHGLASLGVRVAAPLAWGYVGWSLTPKSTDGEDRSMVAVYCGIAGAASAILLDSAALAWKDVPVQPSDGPTFALTPVVDAKRAGLSLSGTF
jgi:hypothetical protein